MAAAIVFVGLLPLMPTARAMLIAFDVGATLFLALITVVMIQATPETMRHRAQLPLMQVTICQQKGSGIIFSSLSIAITHAAPSVLGLKADGSARYFYQESWQW